MDKAKEFEPGSIVDFKMTLCPAIDAPVRQGTLIKYCRVPGWQSVFNRKTKATHHYPVKLAMVRLESTGEVVRVDAQCILNIHSIQ